MSNGEDAGIVTFRDATNNGVIIDRNGMGAAVGDVDNDGDLDWFVTGIFGSNETVGNRLYLNDGTGTLEDATVGAGVEDGGWGWGACFADFNLDGRLDIFHTNGWESNPIDDFENDRSRLFIAQARAGSSSPTRPRPRGMTDTEQGRGVVCADFDEDGDVDIFMTNRGLENSGAFWENDDAGERQPVAVRAPGRQRAEHRGRGRPHPRDARRHGADARGRGRQQLHVAEPDRAGLRARRARRRPIRSRSSGRTAASTATPTWTPARRSSSQ